MLFLLKDDQGRALLMAESGSKSEVDAFGRAHLPEFCGDIVELCGKSQADAEEFWGVRTVKLLQQRVNSNVRLRVPSTFSTHFTWVRGPELPEDVERDGLLTEEDRRAITLDHIARTSDVIGSCKITLSSAPSRAGRSRTS